MYFCRRGDMPQHVDSTYSNHLNFEREEASGVSRAPPPHGIDRNSRADRFNRVNRAFEDHTANGRAAPLFKRTTLREDRPHLNANNARDVNSPKMGQKNAKTNNEGIFQMSNDAYNSRYSNLTYNHAGEMNPRNYNFNNIKIAEDEENHSCSMNPASNAGGGHMGSHPNGSVLDHRKFPLKGDDMNQDHLRPQHDYARVNRENWGLGGDHHKGNGAAPYHQMFNNDMGLLTQNRVGNPEGHRSNEHHSNEHRPNEHNSNSNLGGLHPQQYKHNNRMFDDKYEQLKNKWDPPPSYLYGNAAAPTAPPTAPPIAPPVGTTQKSNADLYDTAGKANSPPYGTHFNMNALYNHFNNAGQWKDMPVRPFANRDNMSYDQYEGGGNFHENLPGNQPNASIFGKNKPPDIDDIIKKYTAKENQEDHFKFNWGHAKNEVTGGGVFKGSSRYMNDGDVRNYLPSEERTGNHANASPNYTPQHNGAYGFNQNGGYPANPSNAANPVNPVNAANPANPANPANAANSGSAPLLYPNFSSLRNKEKDEEEKKREKKINLLKNIIVTNPNPKYNFSFDDDLYESLPAHENFYLNTSSLADFNHMANGNHPPQGQNDLLGEGLQNRVSAYNNVCEDFNALEKLNETPGVTNRHHFKSEVLPIDEDCYGERFGGERLGGDRFGGDRFGGDRFGGDRFGGDRFGGDRFGMNRLGADNLPRDHAQTTQRNDENCRYEKHSADREFGQNPFPRGEPGRDSNHPLGDRDKHSTKLYDESSRQRAATPLGAFTNNTRLHSMMDVHPNQENNPPPLIDLLENRASNHSGEKTFGRPVDLFGKMGQMDYLKRFENSTQQAREDVFRTSESARHHGGGAHYGGATHYGGAAHHGGAAPHGGPSPLRGDHFSNINHVNIFKTHAKSGDHYEEGSLLSKNQMNEPPKQTNRYLQEDPTKPSNGLFNIENIFQGDKRNGLLNEGDKSPLGKNEGPSHMYMFERERNPHLDLSIREKKNLTYRDDKDIIRRPCFDRAGRTLFEPYDGSALRTRQGGHFNGQFSGHFNGHFNDQLNGRFNDQLNDRFNACFNAHLGSDRDALREGDHFGNPIVHRREDEHMGTICTNRNDDGGLFPKASFHFLGEKKNSTNFGEATTPTGKVPTRDEPTKEQLNNNSYYNSQRRASKTPNSLFSNYHSGVKTNQMHDHPTGVPPNQHWAGGAFHNEQEENKTNANMLKTINPPAWKYEASQNVIGPTSNVSFQSNFNQTDNETQGGNLLTLFNNDLKKNVLGGNRDGESGLLNGGPNWGGNHHNLGTTGAKAFLGILSEEQNRYTSLLNTVGRYAPRDGLTRDGLPRDGHNPLSSYTNKKPFNPSGAHNFSFVKQPLHKQLPPLPFKHLGKQANAEGAGQTKLKALEAAGRPKPGEGNHFVSNHIGGNPLGGNPLGGNPLGGNHLGGNPLGGNPPTCREKSAHLGALAELTPFDRYGDGKDALHRRGELFLHKNEPKECTLRSGDAKVGSYHGNSHGNSHGNYHGNSHSNNPSNYHSNYLSSYLGSHPDQPCFPNEKNAPGSLAQRNGRSKYSLGEAADGYLGGDSAAEKDYQFDFLCLAVLIYEMCTKYNTYYSSKFEDITERIYNTNFFFPHFVSFELKNFCYELCSKRRQCFSDLKNHAWFQKNLNF
ncbi:hypothetical protein PVNG_02947 [Plasmodium vivax North Korean]|uniref:Protein kinase domain-containing protein n=1 Tax=Plasmodium vivax North Korean TaxID=1035514 RepID=A0A0J9U0X8_PLAVI|nr:hypothetical protein PVNG_02947 [Plasmodium vivax North Korean]